MINDKTRKAYSYFEALVNRSSPENYKNMAELLQPAYVNYKAGMSELAFNINIFKLSFFHLFLSLS